MGPTRTVKTSSKLKKGSKGTSKANVPEPNRTKISKKSKAPPPKQQKTKSAKGSTRKKKRVYFEKELGVPKLNMITPVGVDLPKGKKKGKIFVDDQESMMTIFTIVNANNEGQIESKLLKSRHMEEIREARKKEAEAREQQRKSKLEDTKDSMRKKRKRKSDGEVEPAELTPRTSKGARSDRKRVSFA